ncbi:MAG: universal stress protein, partial [Roseimicrobium sp.]
EVILLHVVSPDPVVVDFGMAPTVYRPPSPETIAAEGNRLAELQESLEKFGVRTTTRQIQGTRVEDLIEECRRLGAELIIVGSHGHGAVYNLLVGSITSQILKSAPCPVLVVPNGDKPAESGKE